LSEKVSEIEVGAFADCLSLASITIPKSITKIGIGAFQGCGSLQNIKVDGGNETYKDIDGVLFSKDGSSIVCYPEGKTALTYKIPDGVERTETSAFKSSRLASITIPASVTQILRQAFQNCTNLTKLTILGTPRFIDAEEKDYNAFDGCPETLVVYVKDESYKEYLKDYPGITVKVLEKN